MAKKTTKSTPKRKSRRDWKPIVLRWLAKTSNIGEACKRAKIDRHTFYNHRNADPVFAAQVEDALESGTEGLELIARKRAEKTSDTLMIFLLKSHRPEKYRERYDVRHGGHVATGIESLTDDELATYIAELDARRCESEGRVLPSPGPS